MKKRRIKKPAGKRSAALRLVSMLIALSVMPFTVFFSYAMNGEGSEPEMILPTYIFDFTDESTFDLGLSNACTTEITDDGLKATVFGDDPQFSIGSMDETGSSCSWIVIRFRGEPAADVRSGELYFATENREYSERTRVYLKYGKVTDEWQTLITNSRVLSRLDEEITSVRFDPYTNAGGEADLVMDETLEVAFIAFFGSEEDARAFDYGTYKEASAVKPTARPDNGDKDNWKKPQKTERYVLREDNCEGTLKLVSDPVSGSFTVKYGEGDGAVSATVPDNAFFRNGPLSGIDALGRALPDQHTVIDPDYIDRDENGNAVVFDADSRLLGVYGSNGRRYVGIFYFLWHGTMNYDTESPRNIQELLDRYGDKAKDMNELWGRTYFSTFYFSKPLYGYYRSDDEWVIRRHLELLINAGIDFLYFDTTNNYLYERSALKIMEICHELNEQGYAAPKVVFYTHTDAEQRVMQAYRWIYSKGLYPDTWFMLDGKPLIIAPAKANVDDFSRSAYRNGRTKTPDTIRGPGSISTGLRRNTEKISARRSAYRLLSTAAISNSLRLLCTDTRATAAVRTTALRTSIRKIRIKTAKISGFS